MEMSSSSENESLADLKLIQLFMFSGFNVKKYVFSSDTTGYITEVMYKDRCNSLNSVLIP